MSNSSSEDEIRDELQIKPPQAHGSRRRDRKRESDKYRSKHKKHKDDDRSRSRGEPDIGHGLHRSRGYSSQSGREKPYSRSHTKPSSSRHSNKSGRDKYAEFSAMDSRDDPRKVLSDKEMGRKHIEEEEEQYYKSMMRRNEIERRQESRKAEARGKPSSSPEPDPQPMEEDERSQDKLRDINPEKNFVPEVEDIEESSSDMDEGGRVSPAQKSHSDVSASDNEKLENGKPERTPNSVISDDTSASPSGSESSKSSDGENENERNGTATKSGRNRAFKSSAANSPDGSSRSGQRSPTVVSKDQGKYPHGNSEEIEVKEATDVLSSLPPYYPAIQGCRRVEEFHLLNRIEEGTYGVVYRAKDKRTNEIVALKKLKMEKEKDGFPITSLREINTLLKAQHENIVTVREIVVGSNTDKIYLVMDYVEHDLKSLMETLRQKDQAFMMGEVKCLMLQLLRAVAHLHDNWILHRDLKTSNLLLSHKGILKVGDFGLAREYGSPLKAYTSIVVTLWYRAPELLLGQKEYSTPIDIWSVGCIFGELLKMEPMFQGKSEPNQLNLIFQTLGTPNDKIWPGYSQLPLLQRMTFADNPRNKLKTRFHMLSDAGIDLMNKFLTFNPAKRITADDALNHPFFIESPLPIDPSVFPTWPAKSETGHRMAPESPKPPSGGRQFKDLRDEDGDPPGFFLGDGGRRQGAGFNLKF